MKERASCNEIVTLLGGLSECEKHEVWNNILSCEKIKNTASWEELMGFVFYAQNKNDNVNHNLGQYSFQTEPENERSGFYFLESIGVNYDHVDVLGENFAHYILRCLTDGSYSQSFKVETYHDAYGVSRFLKDERRFYVPSQAVNYILQKTTDVNLRNKKGENVLFYYLSAANGGLTGSKFMSLHEKFPELDLHCVNKRGVNLIAKAISLGSIGIADYLMNEGVNYVDLKDSAGNDILSCFTDFYLCDENEILFKKVLSKNNFAFTSEGEFKKTNFIHEIAVKLNNLESWVQSYQKKVSQVKLWANWLDLFVDVFTESEFSKDEKTLKVLEDEVANMKAMSVMNNEIINQSNLNDVLIKADRLVLMNKLKDDLSPKDVKIGQRIKV